MDLMTMDEVAEAYPIFPLATLRFWRHKGTGPVSFKIGRRVVYKRADVEAWIERQYTAAGGGKDAA